MNMKYNIEIGNQLVNELVDLWAETMIKCDRIEELVKQLKEESEK